MKSLFEDITKKLIDYNRRYSDHPSKFALKACSYCALVALKSIFKNKKTFSKDKKSENIKIAFVLSSMLGDVLVNLHYIEEFHKKIQQRQIPIDIYTSISNEVIAGLLFNKNFVSGINKDVRPDKKNYDLIIEIIRYPEIIHYTEKVVSDNDDFLSEYTRGLLTFKANNPLFYLNENWGDRVGIEYARLKGRTRRTQANINDYLDLDKTNYYIDANPHFDLVLKDHGLSEKKYITFQRGIAGAGEFTRLWSLENYVELVRRIKLDYPEYKLVQLGRIDNKKIEGIDIDLRGKTNFEELKNLLKKAALHVDGDCGMVHFRHALRGGTSLVFFGPTSPDFIGYPENVNLRGEGCPNFCEWINNSWQDKCLAGFDSPPCMVTPDIAYKHVKTVMDSKVPINT